MPRHTILNTAIMSNNDIYFWKPEEENGFLSNSSNHKLVDSSIIFKTVEHYISYQQALLMNDTIIINEIINAENPKDAITLGRKVKNWNSDKWEQNREKIIYNALMLKVKQHPHIKDFILNSGDAWIAYASPFDPVLGTGVTRANSKGPGKFPGLNLLGKAWMTVRNDCKNPM